MADYKESTISGTSWQRAFRVVIDNPYGGVPTLNFVEEKAFNFDGEVTTKPCSNLVVSFDPENPTHMELYVKLNEMYMALALERDAKITPPAPEVIVEPTLEP